MANRLKLTKKVKALFLERLRKTCNVTMSCKAINITRRRIYYAKNAQPDFSDDWDAAIAEGTDMLESEARRRAVDGYEEPVFYQGEQVGVIRRYSDRMLELLLKGHLPEKYKDRVQHTGDVGVDVTEQALLAARKRASWREKEDKDKDKDEKNRNPLVN